MSPQHDFIIDNSTGANVRADINSVLQAIASNNSGSSAPSTTYALQSFANTTDSMLQLRNAANNAFVNLRKFDGSLPLPDGSASSPSLFFDDDTNTGIFSSAANTFDISTGGVSRLQIDTSEITFNESGENTDFRVESDANSHMFFVDGGNNRIGINKSSPTTIFDVFHATTNNVANFESGDATVSISFKDSNTTTVPTVGAAGNDLQFFTNGLGRVFINSSGRVGIGTTSQTSPLHVFHATTNAAIRAESGDEFVHLEFKDSTTSTVPYIGAQGDVIRIITGGQERFRQESSNEGTGFGGATLVTYSNMANHSGTGSEGARIRNDGAMVIGTSNNQVLQCNRRSTDGTLINFRQNGSSEGSIDVSGSSVSYNGGHLSRWSQLKGISSTDKSARPTIYQGTVLSNLDELCTWSHAEVLYDEDVLYTLEDTLPEGKSVGDVKIAKGTVLREAYTEENQQLNMTKVSDVDGDKDVAGVFWAWDDDDDEYVNDFFVAMTGDMVIRVAASTTVARGDLLISAGDGTAKPQTDDIIRSSTIAKIISTNHTATYADGSKAYPCVLMAC
tara:strand:+ start:31 stop:1716 length:1686 start_codon:yes stop_codon:yes gene_type:complete